MGISSNELVLRDSSAVVQPRAMKALTRREQQRRTQLIDRVLERRCEVQDHLDYVAAVEYATESDVHSVARLVRSTREEVDGDPLVASAVAPLMNTAVNKVQAHLQHTF
jgi:hypothetical protein